jgi:transmembrane sensor
MYCRGEPMCSPKKINSSCGKRYIYKSNIMKHDFDLELLLRYLDGNLSPIDETAVQQWLDADKGNRERLNRLQKIWNTPEITLPLPDLEEAWSNITDKIATKEQTVKKKFYLKQIIDSAFSFRPLFRQRIGVATAFITLILISIISVILIQKYPKSVKMQEIRVGLAKQDTINLPDGTNVILDAGSALQFPEEFSDTKREIFLDGEGLFRVTHDPDKPFIIHANDARITVLGTEFNVRAWQQHKKVIVAVIQGTVALRDKNSEGEVLITDKQYSILDDSRYPSLPQEWDGRSHISWMQREIYFKGVALREVLEQLQRWYDVTFELPDDQTASNSVTVFIRNVPIVENLNLLALVNNFEYEQQDKKIIFSRKK